MFVTIFHFKNIFVALKQHNASNNNPCIFNQYDHLRYAERQQTRTVLNNSNYPLFLNACLTHNYQRLSYQNPQTSLNTSAKPLNYNILYLPLNRNPIYQTSPPNDNIIWPHEVKSLQSDQKRKVKNFNIASLIPEIAGEEKMSLDNKCESKSLSSNAESEPVKTTIHPEILDLDCNKAAISIDSNIKDTKDVPLQEEPVFLYCYRFRNTSEFYNTIDTGKERKEMIMQYFLRIENDYNIKLNFLVNLLGRSNIIDHLELRYPPSIYMIIYEEFYNVLNEQYPDSSIEIHTGADLNSLYLSFIKFMDWVEEKYFFMVIEKSNNYNHHLKCFNIHMSKESDKKENDIINFYLNILTEDNYSILYKILPELELIHEIKRVTVPFRLHKIIFYLQLIICKFEVFRFNYFYGKTINGEDLEILYQHPEFNEMVAVISIIFKKLMSKCNIFSNISLALEFYSFSHFLRIKHLNLFEVHFELKAFLNSNFSQNKYLDSEKDEQGYVNKLIFTTDFSKSLLFQTIIANPLKKFKLSGLGEKCVRKYKKRKIS